MILDPYQEEVSKHSPMYVIEFDSMLKTSVDDNGRNGTDKEIEKLAKFISHFCQDYVKKERKLWKDKISPSEIQYLKLPARSVQRDHYNCGLYMCYQIQYLVGCIAYKNEKDIRPPKKGDDAYKHFQAMFPVYDDKKEIDMLYMRKCIILLVKRLSMLWFDNILKIKTVSSARGEMTKKCSDYKKYVFAI